MQSGDLIMTIDTLHELFVCKLCQQYDVEQELVDTGSSQLKLVAHRSHDGCVGRMHTDGQWLR